MDVGELLLKAGIDLSKFDTDKRKLMQSVIEMNGNFLSQGDTLADAIGNTIREQSNAIKEIESELAKVRRITNGMASGDAYDALIAKMGELKEELNLEKGALRGYEDLANGLNGTTDAVTRMRTQYMDARNKLAEFNLAMKEGRNVPTAEYQQARDEVQRLGMAMAETNREVNRLSQGGLTAVVQNLGTLAGGLSTAQSLIGVFGDRNENLNKIMLKAQALLSASVTLNQIRTTQMESGGIIAGVVALQENLRARAINSSTVATGRATIAQRLYNIVANANPYVLLATAIITVVGAIALYVSATSEAVRNSQLMADINEKVADSIAEPLTAYKTLQAQWNSLGNDLKAKEKFVKENEEAFQKLGVEVNNVSSAENFLVAQSDKFIESMKLKAQASAYAQKAMENYKKAVELQSEYERIYVDKNLTVFEQVIDATTFDYQKKAQQEKAKAEIEQVNKDADRQIEVQLAKIEQAKSKLANANIKEYVRPEKTVKTKKEKVTKEKKADEYLPPGSVAEIEKRINEINKALSKSVDIEQIEKLKTKRISAIKELLEAEKKIKTLSFEEELKETKKAYDERDKLAETLGKDVADELFPDLKDNDYIVKLRAMGEELNGIITAGQGTKEIADNFALVNAQIEEITGQKSKLDEFKETLDSGKTGKSSAEYIAFLESQKTEEENALGIKKNLAVEELIKAEKLLIQEKYMDMLADQQTFEEKSLALQKEYEEMKNSDQYKNASQGDKNKIDKSFSDRQSVISIDILKESADWQMAFGDMEYVSQNALARIEATLVKFKETQGATLAPTELRELENAIKRVKDAQASNPFASLVKGMGTLKTANIEVKNATEAYNATLDANGNKTEASIKASERMTKADMDQAQAKRQLVADIGKAQSIFNEVGNGVRDIGESLFGGFDDATNDAIDSIMEVGNAVADFATSLLNPTDIGGMIKAGVALIGSVFKALNGDKKKEREIQKNVKSLKGLEQAYNDIAFAAERAFGSQKYSGQQDLIRNLEQQKIAISAMLSAESGKKKKDQGKIDGYNQQMQSINQSIAELKEGIIKDVLQTDIPDMASKLGDALVDAFARGEDGAKSLEKTANDMIKNLLKNQLNLALQSKMKPILDNLMQASGFNADGTGSFTGLTPQQIADFRAQVVQAGQSMNGFLEGYSEIFGGLEENAQGMKGDIKGISEKTAGALESNSNTMRINQVTHIEISRDSLTQLSAIEFNTRNLIQMRLDIAEMNGKMKKGLAGID